MEQIFPSYAHEDFVLLMFSQWTVYVCQIIAIDLCLFLNVCSCLDSIIVFLIVVI